MASRRLSFRGCIFSTELLVAESDACDLVKEPSIPSTLLRVKTICQFEWVHLEAFYLWSLFGLGLSFDVFLSDDILREEADGAALSHGEEKLLDEAIHSIVCNHFLNVMLLHQKSARDVELFVARDLVAPPVVSSLAAAIETATAIDNEASDLMDPVAGAEIGCCNDSLHKS